MLVGAPESGKTELARQVATALDNCGIVDDYIDVITKRSDIAMSHFATYIGNMMCAVGRLEHERTAAKQWDNLVVCGSLIETSVYQAINAYTHATTTDDPGFREASDKRTQVTMVWLSMLRADSWDYDLAFYLPFSEEYKTEDDHKWSSVVDDQIKAAAEAFDIDLITLPTDSDARLEIVLEKVREANEATEADRSAVGVGGAGSPENGDSDSDMLNVSDEA